MNIALAQTNPITGNIEANITAHKAFIESAISQDATLIIFPELSLTGYEPALAKNLVFSIDDPRFSEFQILSDQHRICIGLGLPIKAELGIRIGLVLFQPDQQRQCYFKHYLHEDELPYFVPGPHYIGTVADREDIALAICYELSVPDHAITAYKRGAKVYIASVSKTISGTEKAKLRLSEIAKTYQMTVMMANFVGKCEGQANGGQSAVWNSKGELMNQLNDHSEDLLIIDV